MIAPPPVHALDLAGKVVLVDPGHDGGNAAHPSVINRQVAIGGGRRKACDTAGTETDAGYAEHAYTWDLSQRVARLLRARGATVVLTRRDDRGVGPCIDERARIGNRAHADAAISLHADGGPAGGRGFHVIRPTVIRGLTDDIAAPSHRLALDVRSAFRAGTGMPYATYIGRRGLDVRSDLGGLRLSDVPKVFLETGNMRNARDAALLSSPAWRQRAAGAVTAGLAAFLLRG